MDSNEFTQNFWNLSEKNAPEVIVKSAESIVELLETKQKTSKHHEIKNRQKFRLFLNVFQNASEDLVYTLSRLIGGLSSIQIELRKGYLLTLKLILEKFRNSLNFGELINAIEKETNLGKSETNYVRNCATSGKLLMLQSALDIPSISSEHVLKITKSLCEILVANKLMEETVLYIFKIFFEKLTSDYYHDFNFSNAKNSAAAQKNFSKIMQSILEILQKFVSLNKSQIGQTQKMWEFSLYFLIAKIYLKAKNSKKSAEGAKERIVIATIESQFGTGFLNSIMDDSAILGFFKLIVKNSLFQDNENLKNSKNNKDNKYNERSLNISLDFFFEILKLNKDKEKVYKIWNLIIDENTNQILTEISPKNFQQLIYSVSKFVLKNFFHLDYVKQIFEHSFFLGFIKFRIKQKFKYLGDIIGIVTENLHKLQEAKGYGEEVHKKVSEYALDLLKTFGNNPQAYISIQTFKAFHAFLFNSLTEEDKEKYISKLSDTNSENEVADFLEDENDYLFRISALKQLVNFREIEISDDLKQKIIEFFFVEYMNNSNMEITNNLEEKLLQTVLNYCKEDLVAEESEVNAVNKIRDVKICKKLKKIHAFLLNILKANKVGKLDEEDLKAYKTFLKKFENYAVATTVNDAKSAKSKGKKSSEANGGSRKSSIDVASLDEKTISLNKIALVLLIPFLKDSAFFAELLNVLSELLKFGDDWQRAFCELNIEIFKIGNNALSDFCLNSFKKMSKYMDKSSFDFLLEFMNSEKKHVAKFEDIDMEDAESLEDIEEESDDEENDD